MAGKRNQTIPMRLKIQKNKLSTRIVISYCKIHIIKNTDKHEMEIKHRDTHTKSMIHDRCS